MSPAVEAAIISAAATIAAVLVTWWLAKRKIQEIHVLVNSRLDDALKEIKSLKDEAKHDG